MLRLILALVLALALINPAWAAGLPVVGVTASFSDGTNIPARTIDGDLSTNWVADGAGQHITYDLGQEMAVGAIKIAWKRGDVRTATFDVLTSIDGETYAVVLGGHTSSGTTLALEEYGFPAMNARHVRIVGHGNSENMWTNITEVEIIGASNPPTVPLETGQLLWDWAQGDGPAADGFRVKCGASPSQYTTTLELADPATRGVALRDFITELDTYYCAAFAYNAEAESAPSNEVAFEVFLAVQPLSTPQNLRIE